MKKILKDMYNGLGNSKSQRFWRLFLILSLFAGVAVVGFKYDAIRINLGWGSEATK